jgi:hypothetical protein
MASAHDAWALFDDDSCADASVGDSNTGAVASGHQLAPAPAAGVSTQPAPSVAALPATSRPDGGLSGLSGLRLRDGVPVEALLGVATRFVHEHAPQTMGDLAGLLESPAAAAAGSTNGDAAAVMAGAKVLHDALGALVPAVAQLASAHGVSDGAMGGPGRRGGGGGKRKGKGAAARGGATDGGPDASTFASGCTGDAPSPASCWAAAVQAADAVTTAAYAWLAAHRAWPHIAWRETYAMGQVVRGVGLVAYGASSRAMEAVDMALIMGAPSQEIEGLVQFIDRYTLLDAATARAASARALAAVGGATSSAHLQPAHPEDAVIIPPVLGADAWIDPAVLRITAATAMPRVAARTLGRRPKLSLPDDAAAVAEHPALTALRAVPAAADATGSAAAGGAGGSARASKGGAATAGAGLTFADFRRTWVRKQLPVVLCGATADWPAMVKWRRLGYFCSRFGHRTVPIEIGQHLSGFWAEEPMLLAAFMRDYVAASASWGWGVPFTVSRGVAGEPTPAAPRGANGAAGSAESAPSSVGGPAASLPSVSPPAPAANGGDSSDPGERIARSVPPASVAYLAQHGLFEQLPELAEDIDIPLYAGAEVGSVNAWFGTAGTTTRLHYDSYENLLTQVVGYKYVRMYAPADRKHLYAITKGAAGGGPVSAGAEAELGASAAAAAPAAAADAAATTGQENVSAVDVEAPDLGRFPLFAHATPHEAVLGPGDMLYIPRGWWHYVRSLTPSMSINFWF